MPDLFGLRRGHFLELGLGRRIGEHAGQHLELGAQPPHFARGSGDRLDRRIVLRQPHEFVGRQVPAAMASASSCLLASIEAIRSDEIWVIARSLPR